MRIICKKSYKHLKWIEKKYIEQCDEIHNLKKNMMATNGLINSLQRKLQGLKAVIFDIQEDSAHNKTFICVQDNRAILPSSNSDGFYKHGDVDIFVLSSIICPSDIDTRIIDMPYLQASFYEKSVHIDELHCDIDGERYENKWYGTMLVNTLKKLCEQTHCRSITGELTRKDADTEAKKKKRNDFYKSQGFTFSFEDEECRAGSISYGLETLKVKN